MDFELSWILQGKLVLSTQTSGKRRKSSGILSSHS
jgi:hypothetical protein